MFCLYLYAILTKCLCVSSESDKFHPARQSIKSKAHGTLCVPTAYSFRLHFQAK